MKLDRMAREFILDHRALPACLGYRGYTRTVCISVNHVVCHGIPSERALREGDIANIDVTLIVDGWHGDHSLHVWRRPHRPPGQAADRCDL